MAQTLQSIGDQLLKTVGLNTGISTAREHSDRLCSNSVVRVHWLPCGSSALEVLGSLSTNANCRTSSGILCLLTLEAEHLRVGGSSNGLKRAGRNADGAGGWGSARGESTDNGRLPDTLISGQW